MYRRGCLGTEGLLLGVSCIEREGILGCAAEVWCRGERIGTDVLLLRYRCAVLDDFVSFVMVSLIYLSLLSKSSQFFEFA